VADRIRKIAYYYTMVSNRAGSGAQVLRVLREAGVNLLAFSGFPAGRLSQLVFVPVDAGAFRRAMGKAGVALSPRKLGFLIEGRDRVGACAHLLDKLAAARINVVATDAVTAGRGRYGAILWVKPRDVAKAGRILGAR
jgi:hypothetical protein